MEGQGCIFIALCLCDCAQVADGMALALPVPDLAGDREPSLVMHPRLLVAAEGGEHAAQVPHSDPGSKLLYVSRHPAEPHFLGSPGGAPTLYVRSCRKGVHPGIETGGSA